MVESSSGEDAKRRRAPRHKPSLVGEISEFVVEILLELFLGDHELLAIGAIAGYSVGIVALFYNAPMAALLVIAVLALVIATGSTSLWLRDQPDLPPLQRLALGAAIWTGVAAGTALLGFLPMVAAAVIIDS